jgi:predicted nucleic acid-binding protein
MVLVDTNGISEARKGSRANLEGANVHLRSQRSGSAVVPSAIDQQIAAIALLHDLTVVTRNTADFLSTGVALLNPFHSATESSP